MSSNGAVIVIPADIDGSWAAMLAIYHRLEENDAFFSWDSDAEFHRHKGLKSKEMAVLLRHLAECPIRREARVGGSLFGVVLKKEAIASNRIVALHVLPDRRYEVQLIELFSSRNDHAVLETMECELVNAYEHVARLLDQS